MLKKTFVVFAGLGLLIATGCAKGTTDAPVTQPQPGMGAQTDEHRQIAPLVVKLVAVSQNASTGETELRADFEAREALPYPVSVTIVPPPGGLLLVGMASESMNVGGAGRFSKTYKIRSQGPLTSQAPVKLIVDGSMPDKSAGLHAEPQFPAVAESFVPPRQGPTVPGGRPPAPTRRLARSSPAGVSRRSHLSVRGGGGRSRSPGVPSGSSKGEPLVFRLLPPRRDPG